MHFLILSILSSTFIAVIFKITDKIKIRLLPVIVINYLTATLLGYILSDTEFSINEIYQSDWFYGGLIIGVFLIAGFYLIGYSTQKTGIAITTISNKMSVVIPILFSMFYYNESKDSIKFIGILLALLAIILSVHKKNRQKTDYKLVWLPILLFIVLGIIDSLIKYSQTSLNNETLALFTILSFGTAGITGIIAAFFNKTKIVHFFHLKTILSGILLGTANFGSMYFIILALNNSGLDSSIVFGINNVSIISLSILIAFLIFKEQLKPINWVGIFLSILSVVVLSRIFI